MNASEKSRYVIGIDLGTTHCVMAWVDTLSDADENFGIVDIPQLVSGGVVNHFPQLPSFIYMPGSVEFEDSELALPWGNSSGRIVGDFARKLGIKTPTRLIASAKSWLCHGGSERYQPILPLSAPDDVEKLSPVTAIQQYLQYLQSVWNDAFSEYDFVSQEVVVTIPASFDPLARELTAQALEALGVENFSLLEEPQAALYSWLLEHEQWREQLKVGDVLLVVDIGGGTSDFSLINVQEREGQLELERIAVGNHILLGGDNMDLALAYSMKQQIEQEGHEPLQAWQIQGLTQSCREAKEALLSDDSLQSVPVVVASRGSKLFAKKAVRAELTRSLLEQVVLQGFFPKTSITEHPVTVKRGALVQKGLPYAQDAAITKHLAAFLSQQITSQQITSQQTSQPGSDHNFVQPTKVLFNGGVLKAPQLAHRLIETFNDWLTYAGAEPLEVLDNADLDLAVAKGAAYFGQIRREEGVRIRGGIASTFYIGVESAMPAVPGLAPPLQAVCIAPFGMEEGSAVELEDAEFNLVVGEPVQFRFFGSTVRKEDAVGNVLESWQVAELTELPEIEVVLSEEGYQAGEQVPVTLAAKVTEVGTLELEALSRAGTENWKVALDVRQPA